MRRGTQMSKAQAEALYARIRAVVAKDPELPATRGGKRQLAERFGVTPTTIKHALDSVPVTPSAHQRKVLHLCDGARTFSALARALRLTSTGYLHLCVEAMEHRGWLVVVGGMPKVTAVGQAELVASRPAPR